MATWLVGHVPWFLPLRVRPRFGALPSQLSLQAYRQLNIALQTPSPASLEIETMQYPMEHLDPSVFEPMSEEYAFVSSPVPHHFTPLSSAETLLSYVLKSDFRTAEVLLKEMTSLRIPVPPHPSYADAALDVIMRSPRKESSKQRLDRFSAWLTLIPDRHEKSMAFFAIRKRIFLHLDHLNLPLVYRFGLILASKGYFTGNAALQVVSTLAHYARTWVLEHYLIELENLSRDYCSKRDAAPSSQLLGRAYNVAVRTVALAGKTEAALDLVLMGKSRGHCVNSFTLSVIVKHSSDKHTAMVRIQALYPSWTLQSEMHAPPSKVKCETIPPEQSTDIAVLAARLRSLRTALRSHPPPTPHVLLSFITSYQALGRHRAIRLLRSLAYRRSQRTATVWAFTEMLYHRSRRAYIHILLIFSRHFHPVGIPQKTLKRFVKGERAKDARKERFNRRPISTRPREKLWPTAYHTSLVWEAMFWLSTRDERRKLYSVMVSLVRQSKQEQQGYGSSADLDLEVSEARMRLPPNTFDSAHFTPFISSWAWTEPAMASRVLRDMQSLGVQPSAIQWGILARVNAQNGDPSVALRILDSLTRAELGETEDTTEGGHPSDALLGAHSNVLYGFVVAGNLDAARTVETRLVERLGYQAGTRRGTDASIAHLRTLENKAGQLRT